MNDLNRLRIKILCGCMVPFLVTANVFSFQAERETDSKQIDKTKNIWLDSIEKGIENSQITGKPVFVFVRADWCASCLVLEKELKKEEYERHLDRFHLVKLDGTSEIPKIARYIEKISYPCFFAIDGSGKPLVQFNMAVLRSELREFVEGLEVDQSNARNRIPSSEMDFHRLYRALNNEDASVRSVAVEKLKPFKDRAKPYVFEVFVDGTPAMKASARQLFDYWKAPFKTIDDKKFGLSQLEIANLAELQSWAFPIDLPIEQLKKQFPDQWANLNSNDPHVRKSEAQRIVRDQKTKERVLLKTLFEHSDPQIRLLSIDALWRVDIATEEALLIKFLQDENTNLRLKALSYAKVQTNSELRHEVALMIDMDDPIEFLRAALDYLSDYQYENTVEKTLEFVGHPNATIRYEVARAIEQSSRFERMREKLESKIDRALELLVLDADPKVAKAAYREWELSPTKASLNKMLKILKKHPENSGAFFSQLNWDFSFEKSKDFQERKQKFEKEVLIPALKKLTQSKNPELQVAGAIGLNNFTRRRLSDFPVRLLEHTNAEVRLIALWNVYNASYYRWWHWRPNENGIGTDYETWFQPFRLAIKTRIDNGIRLWEWLIGKFNLLKTGHFFIRYVPHDESDDKLPELYQEKWIQYSAVAMRSLPWARKVNPYLRKLANSTDAKEAALASICLIQLGDIDFGFNKLIEVKDIRPTRDEHEGVFTFLPLDKRMFLLKRMLTFDGDAMPIDFPLIAFSFVQNHEVTEEIWKLLEKTSRPEYCKLIISRLYFSSVEPKRLKRDSNNSGLLERLHAELEEKIKSENPVIQYIALDLMQDYFPKQALSYAEDLYLASDDKKLKKLAFDIQFKNDRWNFVSLRDFDPYAAELILRKMVLRDLEDPLAPPNFPKELRAEDVQRWLDSDSNLLCALSEYLLIRMGKSKELGRIELLCSQPDYDPLNYQMLSQAIATVDDNKRLRLLSTALNQMASGDQIRVFPPRPEICNAFYWTTRKMMGGDALELRALFRKRHFSGFAPPRLKK